MIGVELQREELLLGAVEAPWKGESDEVSRGEEVEEQASLQPGGPAPKRLKDESRGLGGRGMQQQGKGGGGRDGQGRREFGNYEGDRGEANGACQGSG